MSRWTFPLKAGVVLALVAFVTGITAATALGWPSGGEEKPPASTEPQHGDKDKGKDEGKKEDEDEDEGKGAHEKPKQQPTQPAAQPPPLPTPPAPPPPAPVVSQGAPPPPAPEQPVEAQVPPAQERVPESPVVAQAPPEAPAAPAAERRELARTGIDPALLALLGALCLGGGGLLFRRALARG